MGKTSSESPDKRLSRCSPDRILKRYGRVTSKFRKVLVSYHRSQEDFFELLENVRIGIAIVDLKGRVIFFNREAEKIGEYSRKEVLRTHFRGFLALDDLEEGFKLFYEGIQGNYPRMRRLRLRKKDGTTIVCEVEVAPFYFQERLRGVIGFFHDISERNKVEEVNRKRVEAFIRFSNEIDEWHQKVLALKKEVNALHLSLGRKEKYSLAD